jgi:hypothetical protein
MQAEGSGDTFANITNATIINRSTLQGSLNKARQIGANDSADVLETVGKLVEQSGNKQAGELFDQFNEELQRSEPRKSVLRNAWDGLVAMLPTVTSIAEAAEAVTKLIG